jgi:hypothetical protein
MEAARATGGRWSPHRRHRHLRRALLPLMQLLVREANNHNLLPIRGSARRCFLFFSSSSCRRRPGSRDNNNNPLRRRHILLRRRRRRCHAVESSARPCCCRRRNGRAEEQHPPSTWGGSPGAFSPLWTVARSPRQSGQPRGCSLLRQPTESASKVVLRRRTQRWIVGGHIEDSMYSCLDSVESELSLNILLVGLCRL